MKPNTRLALLFAITIAAASSARYAQAATDLPMVCTDPSAAGKPVNSACGGNAQTGQLYRTPGDTDLVRINPGKNVGDWNDSGYIFAPWKDLSPGDWYDRCKTDVPEGSLVAQANCTDWGMTQKAGPAAPTFSVTPASGPAPLAVTISWNVPQGTSCQAGGAWTGARPTSGSEQLTLQAGTSAITLACTRPTGPAAPGSAVITWTPPTQNSDGSQYTDPAGYQIYSGTTNPPQVKDLRVTAPSITSRTLTGLPPNTIQYFGVTAVNAAGQESDLGSSAIGSKWIPNTPTAQTWTGSTSATASAPVIRRPKAVTLTVQ
jgi:hypothetical protein